MRVVLVGAPADRDRLRGTLLDAGLQIAGEAASVAEARAAGFGDEALLIAPPAARPRTTPLRAVPTEDLDTADAIVEPLTPREIDVLRWLALGLPNKGIAARLGISDQTVKFHVAAIIAKLAAVNRTDAVRRAARRGLIDL